MGLLEEKRGRVGRKKVRLMESGKQRTFRSTLTGPALIEIAAVKNGIIPRGVCGRLCDLPSGIIDSLSGPNSDYKYMHYF